MYPLERVKSAQTGVFFWIFLVWQQPIPRVSTVFLPVVMPCRGVYMFGENPDYVLGGL